MTIKLIKALKREVNGEKEKLISDEMNYSHGKGVYRPDGEVNLSFKVENDYGRYKVVIPPEDIPNLIESLAFSIKDIAKEIGTMRYMTAPERREEAVAYLRVLADKIESRE